MPSGRSSLLVETGPSEDVLPNITGVFSMEFSGLPEQVHRGATRQRKLASGPQSISMKEPRGTMGPSP
jgi:hypothetical protein